MNPGYDYRNVKWLNMPVPKVGEVYRVLYWWGWQWHIRLSATEVGVLHWCEEKPLSCPECEE